MAMMFLLDFNRLQKAKLAPQQLRQSTVRTAYACCYRSNLQIQSIKFSVCLTLPVLWKGCNRVFFMTTHVCGFCNAKSTYVHFSIAKKQSIWVLGKILDREMSHLIHEAASWVRWGDSCQPNGMKKVRFSPTSEACIFRVTAGCCLFSVTTC